MKYFSLQTNQLVKVLLVFFVAFGITNTLFAQALTGNKTVGTGKDYSTIAAAIADLNLNGVGSGGVTFKVDAGHTETFSSPTAGLVTATGTSTNPIVFIKEGVGANPEITAGVGRYFGWNNYY